MSQYRAKAPTLSSVGTDEPAVALRLFRLLTVKGLLEHSFDVVVVLLERDELRSHLYRATILLEVRPENALRVVLCNKLGIVL